MSNMGKNILKKKKKEKKDRNLEKLHKEKNS